jgi:hypothetical protein
VEDKKKTMEEKRSRAEGNPVDAGSSAGGATSRKHSRAEEKPVQPLHFYV